MRFASLRKIPCLTLLFFFALPSSATILVEGSFKAIVTDYGSSGNHSDFGSPTLGSEINATFSYSLEEYENFTGPTEEPNMYFYGGKNWIHFDIDIGGVNFTVAPNPGAETSSGIIVQYPTPDSWWDFYNMFLVEESYRKGHSQSDPDYVNRMASLLVWGWVDDLGAAQDFSFDEDYDSHFDIDSSGYFNGSFYYEYLRGQLQDFKIASRKVEVPEPSGLLLSSLAFLFIGWRTLQSSKKLIV